MGTTSDPADPGLTHGANDEPVDQAPVYLILSDEERAKGFVQPVRSTYAHVSCTASPGAQTTMGLPIAETYARDPGFYGATYCVACRMHRPVGADGEFVWVERGQVTDLKVGV